jgi:hypothetical protein
MRLWVEYTAKARTCGQRVEQLGAVQGVQGISCLNFGEIDAHNLDWEFGREV